MQTFKLITIQFREINYLLSIKDTSKSKETTRCLIFVVFVKHGRHYDNFIYNNESIIIIASTNGSKN